MPRILFALACLLAAAAAENNGLGNVPAMGWNTWCTEASCGQAGRSGLLHDVCYEKEIKEMAQAMVDNGMKDAGYEYINLDDCWAAPYRTPEGHLFADPVRFPGGIKPLTDWLHAKGLKFGLYTSAGTTTCANGGRIHSIPGSYDHYEKDAASFAAWGVDYVKIDWCGHELNDPEKQHTQFSQALNSTGRPIWLELCRGYPYPPPPYVAKVANSWRVMGDHHDVWTSLAPAIEGFAGATNLSGPGNWAYGDFLMTGGAGCDDFFHLQRHCPGMKDAEYMTEFSIWVITGSPLIVSTDIRNMTDIMKRVLLNIEAIAINQDPLRKPGFRLSGDKSSPQIWAKPVTDGFAVALYNPTDAATEIALDLGDLTPAWKSAPVQVRDVWAHQDLLDASGSIKAIVGIHGTKLYRLKASALQ